MPVFTDFIDLLSAAAVIIIISIIITLAWMSTYVRDQPIVAVVVFQQETINSSSMENIGHTTNNITGPTLECETPTNQSSDSESVQSSSSLEEKIPLVSDTTFENHIQQNDEMEEEIELEKLEDPVPSCSNSSTIPTGQTVECITVEHISGPPEIMEEENFSESVVRNRKCSKSEECETLAEKVIESIVTSDIDTQNEDILRESIRIKLKFLDDTQRLVRGQLTDEVGSFKRANFDPELSSNRVVRLIFNGQLLNRDNSTLGQYGLFDNCVVHCHISQPQIPSENERSVNAAHPESEGLDLSEFLSPLLLVIVAFLWYLRYEYAYIFNTSATIVLVCLTALLLISQYALVISFNVSLGFDGANGNSSSSGNNNSTRAISSSGSSTLNTEPPSIEPNPNVSATQTPNTEISSEERELNRPSDSSSSQVGNSILSSDSDSRLETLVGSTFAHTNHRPTASSSISPILSS